MKRRINKYTEARKMQKGGDYKPSFEEYYKTIPQYKNDTTNYDLRTAYQYLSYEEMKKFATKKKAHLSSVVELPNGNYRFLKSKDHPLLQKELDWYYGNTPNAIKFRNDYDLDKSGNYYQYIKKNQIGDKTTNKERLWISNWLSNRSNLISEDEKNKELSNMNNTKVYFVNPEYELSSFDKARKSLFGDNEKNPVIKAVNNDILFSFNGMMPYGKYSPQNTYGNHNPFILIRKNKDDIKIHELTHSLLPTKQIEQIRKYPIFEKDKYLDNPNEIYSRLNQFRYNNNINPKKVWTIDEIKELRNNKNIKDVNLFNRYTDEFILHLFNNVAYNDTNNEETLNKAQTGMIIQDNMGQWRYPGEITRITGNNCNVPITMQGVNYPVLGVSSNGQKKIMLPGYDYEFDGEYVDEYPIVSKNQDAQQNNILKKKKNLLYDGKELAGNRNTGRINVEKQTYKGLGLSKRLIGTEDGTVYGGIYTENPKKESVPISYSDISYTSKEPPYENYIYTPSTTTTNTSSNTYTPIEFTDTLKDEYFNGKMSGENSIKDYYDIYEDSAGLNIGFGHLLGNGINKENAIEKVKALGYDYIDGKGISYDDAMNLARKDWDAHLEAAKNQYKNIFEKDYGVAWEDLDDFTKNIFGHWSYGVKKGIAGFPKFVKAMVTKDYNTALKESAVKGNDARNKFVDAWIRYMYLGGEKPQPMNYYQNNKQQYGGMIKKYLEGNYVQPNGFNAMQNYNDRMISSLERGDYAAEQFETFAKPLLDVSTKILTEYGMNEEKDVFKKKESGGNGGNIILAENGEVLSTSTGNGIIDGLYHEYMSNNHEGDGEYVKVTNDVRNDVFYNDNVKRISKRVNKYTSRRRNGETFIFPSTFGPTGLLEKRRGEFYPLAHLINNYK